MLDVGSGTGRLAFAAAEKAAFVVASEPVDALREYMRDMIAQKGITNMRVCDGMCARPPVAISRYGGEWFCHSPIGT